MSYQIIVDSGSTKADWLIFSDKKLIHQFQTLGLNPEVISEIELKKRLATAYLEFQDHEQISINFYGSGCGTPRAKTMMREAIQSVIPNDKINELAIYEDTYAAVFATCKKGEAGIVCINGTGSNCSYYDGHNVHQAVESLGYLVMDDFSGVSFGRQLIRHYYFKSLPKDLYDLMTQNYDMQADVIKDHFYKKENPNAYLASFLPFLIEHQTHPFFKEIIEKELSYFVENYIQQFENYQKLPIHFIGSTAFLLKDFIINYFENNQLILGNVYQKPMEGLIKHFTN